MVSFNNRLCIQIRRKRRRGDADAVTLEKKKAMPTHT